MQLILSAFSKTCLIDFILSRHLAQEKPVSSGHVHCFVYIFYCYSLFPIHLPIYYILLPNSYSSNGSPCKTLCGDVTQLASATPTSPEVVSKPRNLKHCILHLLSSHVIKHITIFVYVLAYGTWNNPKIHTLEILVLNLFTNSLKFAS